MTDLTADPKDLLSDLEEAREALRWFKPRWSALGGGTIRLDVAMACYKAGADMVPPSRDHKFYEPPCPNCATHARVNLLIAQQNADLRNVLSDLHEAGVIPDTLRSRVNDLLDLYAKLHAWYAEKRSEFEAAYAEQASLKRIETSDIQWTSAQEAAIDAALEQSQAACGSEVARAAE